MDTITFLSAMFSVGCTLGLVLVVLALVVSNEIKEKRLSRQRVHVITDARKARTKRVY